VVVEVTIAAGTGPTVVLRESTSKAPAVEDCIVRSMKGLDFPRLEGSRTVVIRRAFPFPAQAGSARP
jgi:hypothetical protein